MSEERAEARRKTAKAIAARQEELLESGDFDTLQREIWQVCFINAAHDVLDGEQIKSIQSLTHRKCQAALKELMISVFKKAGTGGSH